MDTVDGTTSKQKKNANVWMDMESVKALEKILGTRQAGAPGVVMLADRCLQSGRRGKVV